MKKYTFYMLLISVSAMISGGSCWVLSYYPVLEPGEDKVRMEDVLKYSNEMITEDNFSCEGNVKANVGSVFASMVEANNLYKRNMLSFGCFEDICTLMLSSCMPWQSQECGNRILKFHINNLNKIQPDTFSCIDIP